MNPLAFGSWPSPIDADQIVAQSLRLGEPRLNGDYLYWLESRPAEKGRTCIVRGKPGEQPEDLIPAPLSASSRANEYGGGSYCVAGDLLFFVLADDQRIYRLDLHSPDRVPVPITPEGDFRYADLCHDPIRGRLIAVREDHNPKDAEEIASLISIDDLGRDSFTLAEGDDFYASPALSPDGRYLSWLAWNHPAMPWSDNSCFVAELEDNGALREQMAIAGSAAGHEPHSLFQPQWSPDGILYLVSDIDNWWRLYRVVWEDGSWPELAPVLEKPPARGEFGVPQWVFGQSTWGFIDPQTAVASFIEDGQGHLCIIDLAQGQWLEQKTPWTTFNAVTAGFGQVAVLAANFAEAGTLAIWKNQEHDTQWQTLKKIPSTLSRDQLSQPQAITFGPEGEQAHGFYYPPFNGQNEGLPGEKPPLIVLVHGGPTSQTHTAFNIKVQYWCTRGFAVVDVNYRGSTGYGRDYRLSLDGQWGISDVEDVCRAAEHLVDRGLADAKRLAIKGGSAGGYTVLAALTFTNTFCAGASLYGIGDLELLLADTHKFESRYLDSLIGPHPESKSLYLARSPVHHVQKLNCPVIFLQGADDKVVPPNQAQIMVKALDEKGIPVAYIEFEGEGHGFRQGPNIVRAVEAELYFYSQLFGFALPVEIEPVEIRNLSKSRQ